MIAHSTDMVLAQANRRNAALLAPQELAVGFWREFPHTGWSGALAERHGLGRIDPNGAFGELDPAALKQETLTLDRAAARAMLDELRELVPDAWLGSTAVSAWLPPYFFRTHALVHMAAGIVVSEQVGAVNEEGFWELRWPDDARSGDERRTIAEKGPVYRVERKPIGEDGTIAMTPRFAVDIQVDLAAIRFIDCMAKEDAEIWFTGSRTDPYGEIGNLVHLPEPGLNYRIGIETVTANGEILQRVPEFDILPNPPEDGSANAGLYLCLPQQSGLRLAPREAGETSPTGKNGREWRVNATAALRPRGGGTGLAYAPLMRTIAEELRPALRDALDRLESSDAVAGLAVVALTFGREGGLPTPGKWNRLEELLAAHGAWEALETVRAWRAEWIEDPEAEQPAARNPPRDGAPLQILVERKTVTEEDVVAALAAVAGGEPKVQDVDRLILRAPPTQQELGAFATADDGAKALEKIVHDMAEEQLFGLGRKLAVLAMKGDATPLRRVVEREAGPAREGQDGEVSS